MFVENIKEAFQNLFNNKMRTLLTMLGIIIGITAVITITTIGTSIKDTLSATMNSLGGNSISLYLDAVYPETEDGWATWEYPELKDEDYITQEMLDELQEEYPDQIAGYAMSTDAGSGQIYKNKDTYAYVAVQGMTPANLEYGMKLNIVQGRSITDQDVKGAKRVCIVADTMADNYFKGEDPIGQEITFEGTYGSTKFVVVGVYEYNDAIFGRQDTPIPEKDRTTMLYTTVSAANNISGNEINGYQWLDIMLQIGIDPDMAKMNIDEFFAEKYADNENWYVYSYSMASEMDTIDTVISAITIAISFIAAISLIVGGVGVMNIMLVSITERTKEIGIRKALGAKNKVIKQQFLIESVVLCLTGGVIGIILGIVLGFLLGKIAMFVINNYYSDMASYLVMNIHPSVLAIILSVGFSMIIGIFFGSYPAKKAAKMEVIDALRYE